MHYKSWFIVPVAALALSLIPARAHAQAAGNNGAPAAQQAPARNSPLYWSVNTILDSYVQQMGRYYSLTPAQQEYTKDLLNQRVKRFLTDYEKDVRWLAEEMWDYYGKGEMPPAEIAKEWGTRAKPLMSAIRHEIIDGNMKWREILTDEQRKQHDKDLDLMNKQFDEWEQKFDRWSKGDVQPSDFPGMLSHQPRTVRKSEDAWEYYVRNFITIYNLDEGQKQTAYSVLRTLREEAGHYRDAHKEEYAKIDSGEAEASGAAKKSDPEEIKKSLEVNRKRMAERRELDKPIAGMFIRLKTQLNEIPTSEQRQARDQKLAKLESISRRGTTRPAGATSQPASAPAGALSEKP
jgi:hypothetical protein